MAARSGPLEQLLQLPVVCWSALMSGQVLCQARSGMCCPAAAVQHRLPRRVAEVGAACRPSSLPPLLPSCLDVYVTLCLVDVGVLFILLGGWPAGCYCNWTLLYVGGAAAVDR
jgi:hypothetical protein